MGFANLIHRYHTIQYVLVYRISDQLLYLQGYTINGKRARVLMLRLITPTDQEVKPTQSQY